jgi:hypothetical protein
MIKWGLEVSAGRSLLDKRTERGDDTGRTTDFVLRGKALAFHDDGELLRIHARADEQIDDGFATNFMLWEGQLFPPC